MDMTPLIWTAAGSLLMLFANQFFGRSRALENEVKQMGQNFARLETKLEGWIERVSVAHAAPAPQQSALSTIRDALSLLELAKNLGMIRISTA